VKIKVSYNNRVVTIHLEKDVFFSKPARILLDKLDKYFIHKPASLLPGNLDKIGATFNMLISAKMMCFQKVYGFPYAIPKSLDFDKIKAVAVLEIPEPPPPIELEITGAISWD
jgi:hypothetical protein